MYPTRNHLGESRIPATAILALLNLLDEFDADVESNVHRVRNSIQEARRLLEECRMERVERLARARQRKEEVERETHAVDSEFWCSI